MRKKKKIEEERTQKKKKVGRKRKMEENRTCKYIFGGCLQGHPGTILSMFMSVKGTANLTSSGYAKIQRHRNHKYNKKLHKKVIITIDQLIESNRKISMCSFKVIPCQHLSSCAFQFPAAQ